MYRRLEKYKEKLQNMSPLIQDTFYPLVWLRGWTDGKKSYIDTENIWLSSDYIRQNLRKHQIYSADIYQVVEAGLETIRYEIAQKELELRYIKKELEQNKKMLREEFLLLKNYKKDTEHHLLEIQNEFHTIEQIADELITVSRKILENKFNAYVSGVAYCIKESESAWQTSFYI